MLANYLRKITAIASLCLPITSLNVQNVLAVDVRDFTLHNNADVDIQQVYMSESGEETWGSDILEVDILAAGESVAITFEDSSDACLYDLKAVTADGKELNARQVNLCEVLEYTIQKKNSARDV